MILYVTYYKYFTFVLRSIIVTDFIFVVNHFRLKAGISANSKKHPYKIVP